MAYIILTDEMGARLENEILVRGWSLRDFAKKSGVSVSAISRYINGEVKKVNARTIYKFATTLGTTVDWLRWGAQQNRKNDLISREALRNVILNDRKLDGVNANWEVNRILVHIDNAPTVDIKDEIAGAYNEGYACGSRENTRPQGNAPTASPKEICIANIHFDEEKLREIVDNAIIRCKDCKYQKKCWHEDKRMKDKGYWIYGCELISDSFVGTPVWGKDNQFCSSAERADIGGDKE